MIKLICTNNQCRYYYEISEEELREHHNKCIICGNKLKITKESLDDAIIKDIYTQAEEYISKWVSQIGWDETLSLIQRHKDQSCYRIYKEILEKRGFILN